MTRACHAAVRLATGKAFSDEEIDDILERLAARKRARAGEDPTASESQAWRSAVAELTREDLRGALIEKRTRLASARSKAAYEAFMARMPEADPSRNFRAFMVGDDRPGFGRGYSSDALGRALQSDIWGQMERELREAKLFDRVTGFLGQADPQFEENIAVEMARLNGWEGEATGDHAAGKVADIFNRAIERGRVMQNLEGAWIGKLDGYVVRQVHDRDRVSGGFWREIGAIRDVGFKDWSTLQRTALDKAFGRWRGLILGLLHERTFDGVEAMADKVETGNLTRSADPRERFLQAIWWDIVTGRHSILKGLDDFGDFRPPPSKARAVSAARVLHFKGPREALAYHRAYGRGSLFSAVVSDTGRAARNTALMRAFGPAPEAAFAARREALLGAARDSGDALGGKRLASQSMERAFEQLNGAGNAPESLRLAQVGRLIRIEQSLTKLGGMVLSAFSDTPVAAQTLRRAGLSWLDSYSGVLAGVSHLGGEQQKRVAELLDVSARAGAHHIASRFTGADGPVGWTSWAMRLFYKVNGFDFWNEGLRAGVAHALAAHLGREADSGWQGLELGTREWLERYGLGEKEWELLRHGAGEIEGRRYLTFDAVDGLTHDQLHAHGGLEDEARTGISAERVREDLRGRLQTLYSDTLDTATSEAGARERLKVNLGTRPGTVFGEAVRLFLQFWAFNTTFLGRTLGPATRGFGTTKPVAAMAHLILGMTLMGYLSRQAKLLASGHEPDRLVLEDGTPNLNVFTASALQGGGLGIYGDFLFGEFNRYGGSPLATLGGPSVGTLEQFIVLMQQLRTGAFGQGHDAELARRDLGPGASRFAVANTPFLNVWYAKLALDYLLIWRMNEHMSPGWARRYQEKVDKDTGSHFWLRPSEAVQ